MTFPVADSSEVKCPRHVQQLFKSLSMPSVFGIQLAKESHMMPPLRAPSHESCHSVNSHFSFSVYLHRGEMINVNEKQ